MNKKRILLLAAFLLLFAVLGVVRTWRPAIRTVLDVPLRNTTWVLESYGSPSVRTRAIKGRRVTIQFNDQGGYHGSAGCNSYGGEYGVAGSVLRTGGPFHTLMACADDSVMKQEMEYLRIVGNGLSYRIAGDRLTLFCSEDRVLAFRALNAEAALAPVTPTPQPQLEIIAPKDAAILQKGPIDIRVRTSNPLYSLRVQVIDFDGRQLVSELLDAPWHATQQGTEGSAQISFVWPRAGTRADIVVSLEEHRQTLAQEIVTVTLGQGEEARASEPPTIARQRLHSRQWRLALLQDGPLRMPMGEFSISMTAQFDAGGKIRGSLNCLEYEANYVVSPNRLSVTDLSTWPRFSGRVCGPLSEWEERYLEALVGDSVFWFDEDRLRIEAGDLRLEFGGRPIAESPSWFDIPWVLLTYESPEGEIPPPLGMVVAFGVSSSEAKSLLSDWPGCTWFIGKIPVLGKRRVELKISDRLCANPQLMDIHLQYVDALMDAYDYVVVGETLRFDCPDGVALTFSAADGLLGP